MENTFFYRCIGSEIIKYVAITGLPGSGKSILSKQAERHNWKVLTMGDVVRDEIDSRGLEHNPETTGQVALDLRREFGETIIVDRLAKHVLLHLSENFNVLIDGIRSPKEITQFTKLIGSRPIVVGVKADENTRYQRLLLRNRAEDGHLKNLKDRDLREIKLGVIDVISIADFLWINEYPNIEDAEKDALLILSHILMK